MNKLIRTLVGADLSAIGRHSDIPIEKLICIIAPLQQTILKAFSHLAAGKRSHERCLLSEYWLSHFVHAYPLLMAEGLHAQLRPSESLAHWECWQINQFNGGQNARQRGVPGKDCCDNAKPATDGDPRGKCASASQVSNGQGKEGQEQE